MKTNVAKMVLKHKINKSGNLTATFRLDEASLSMHTNIAKEFKECVDTAGVIDLNKVAEVAGGNTVSLGDLIGNHVLSDNTMIPKSDKTPDAKTEGQSTATADDRPPVLPDEGKDDEFAV